MRVEVIDRYKGVPVYVAEIGCLSCDSLIRCENEGVPPKCVNIQCPTCKRVLGVQRRSFKKVCERRYPVNYFARSEEDENNTYQS